MAELTMKLTEKMMFDRERCNEDSDCSDCSCCMANDECLFNFTEEHKVGKWIYDRGSYKCPFCEHKITGKEDDLNYCCKCGAEMRGK